MTGRERSRREVSRPGRGLWAALAALYAFVGTGCLGLPRTEGEVVLPVAAELAAWSYAETCRELFPRADPEPLHAGSPMLLLGPGHYRIEYEESPRSSAHVDWDGRLPAPRAVFAGDLMEFDSGRFAPAARHHAARRAGSEGSSLRIELEQLGPERCRMHLYARGRFARAQLQGHLQRNTELLQAYGQVLEQTRRESWCEMERTVAGALDRIGAVDGANRSLLAALYWFRARSWLALGAPAQARSDLRLALHQDAGLTTVRAQLAALDQRLADSQDALRQFQLLAHDRSLGMSGYLLAAKMVRIAREDRRQLLAAERTAELLSRGDRPGAAQWVARMLRRDDPEGHRLAGELAALQGDRQRQVESMLFHWMEAPEQPERLLRLLLAYRDAGDPVTGLRLLCRHLDQMPEGEVRRQVLALEREFCAAIDAGLRARILSSERHALPPLPETDLGASGRALLSRLPGLRAHIEDPSLPQALPRPTAPPFANAPGVTPQR